MTGIDPSAAVLRHAVYQAFAERGAAPSPAELAATTTLTVPTVLDLLHQLHDARALVLTQAGDAIRMAHPFSAAPMGYLVVAAGPSPVNGYPDRMWWGGCAWDSFGISAALGEEVGVYTRCPWCEDGLEHSSGPATPPTLDAVVHLPWPARRWWDDVVQTCTRIRTFCSTEHLEHWTAAHDQHDGMAVPLERLWRLAHPWYSDRLDLGWQPRGREQAQALLDAVGLTGEFWRLR